MNKVDEYIDVLLEEIDASIYKGSNINTIYIGGGTPSAISDKYIVKVIGKIKEVFSTDYLEEITIEINPGTVDVEKLREYYKVGVNRVSVGVQSFDNEMLKRLGRIHNEKDVYVTISSLREVGFNNISLDLMYGLPDDSIDRVKKDLEKVIMLNPEHVSIYGLIIEEGTVFHKEYSDNQLLLPDEDDLIEVRRLINKTLEKAGYYRYEISNYAKSGYGSKHNLIYWHNENYLGFGLNSTSKINAYRYRNTDNLEEYLKNKNNLEKYDLVKIDKNMSFEDEIMLGLRLIKGIDLEFFKAKYKINIEEKYKEVILELEELQLIMIEDGFLKLTEKGFELSNYCILKFLS